MTRILNKLPEILAFVLALVVLVASLHFLAPFLPFYLLLPGSVLFAVFVFLHVVVLFCRVGIWILKFLIVRELSR